MGQRTSGSNAAGICPGGDATGLEELDKSLAMFPSFDFDAALDYLKILRKPWLSPDWDSSWTTTPTNYSFVVLCETGFCATCHPASPTLAASVPGIVGCRLGESWCLKRLHLPPRPHPDMKFDPALLRTIANTTGFPPDNLEKLLRLRELLTGFHKHPFLRNRLVLKGGTAINLFYLDLARLSVDIDLNYIAQVDREKMLAERPDVVRAVEQIAAGLGYRVQNGVDDHALREWYLGYLSHTGAQDRIQVEINFLMRACALPPRELPAARLGDSQPCEFLVLATEELFAGKLKAMIDRQHPRDLCDLFRFTKSSLPRDSETLRRLAVLFSSTMDRDFRTYTFDRVLKVDAKQIDNLLYPLLKADDRPAAAEMLVATKPLIESALDHSRDAAYLAAMGEGRYQPELLFPKQPEIVERIRRHPALLWKADNVARYLVKPKGP